MKNDQRYTSYMYIYTSYDYWKKIGYYFVVSTGFPFYTVKRAGWLALFFILSRDLSM